MTSDNCIMYDNLPEHEYEAPETRTGAAKVDGRVVGGLKRALRLGSSFGCAIPGINLNDYSKLPSGKGWGAACQGNHTLIRLSNGLGLTCRSEIAELSTLLLNEVLRRGYVLRAGVCGCYNCRYIAGTTTWSNHAWALAFDLNWDVNPYTTGTQHDIPSWVVQLLNRFGFAWGGDYTGGRRDYMHFEFMGTPAQAVAATVLARQELGGGGGGVAPSGNAQTVQDQQDLNDSGFPCGEADGVWGPASIGAAKLFQRAVGLPQDGLFDVACRAAIHKIPSWHGPIVGDGGYPISQWQQKLKDHGWRITVNNVWDGHSSSILRQFQIDKNLVQRDGQGCSESWAALYGTVN